MSTSAAPGLSYAWRALRHRNFRLFFFGQSISLIGTWMTRVATSWLVYRLTGSALLLGTISFAGQFPTFLLAPFAGVLVDRMNRHQVLVATQALAMVQSLLLAALTLTHRINIPEVLALSVFQGLINAFDMPVRQSFMIQMVAPEPALDASADSRQDTAGAAPHSTAVADRSDLQNAIALNSSMVNAARLLGPSIAGIVISVSSEGACFLADGLSYLAVLVSLLLMRVPAQPLKRATSSMVAQLAEGWTYVSTFRPIRSILLLFAVVSLMGMPYMVLMPVFAAQVLHGGPHTLGFLMGAAGVGSLTSAIVLVLRKSVLGLTRVLPRGAALFGAGLVGFGFSHSTTLSMLLMVVVGFGMMQGLTASNTIIQTLVPEEKRGRVMSYYTVAFVGMAPFGSLLAGTLAHHIGAPHTVQITGSVCILGAAWFATQMPAMRAQMRPRYEELGILAPKAPVVEAEQIGAN